MQLSCYYLIIHKSTHKHYWTPVEESLPQTMAEFIDKPLHNRVDYMVGLCNLDQLSPSSYNGVVHNLYVAYLYFSKNRKFQICLQLVWLFILLSLYYDI